ncbi:MAG: hypothetical protein JJT99_09055 [Rhodobacteraceae bacterium]|nr:hypothetical protein [Paracoccaceae bacterium]
MTQRFSTLPRPLVGSLALIALALILALDLARSGMPDLFTAPAPVALGSGEAPSGAHCSGG